MNSTNIVNMHEQSRWAVILAGGEGTRLRAWTRAISGDERPKPFCAIVGCKTLLQQTARRVARVAQPNRTKVVLTQGHEQFFDLRTIHEQTGVVIQPVNRGTAPAILVSLLSIAKEDPHAAVALFPADHYHSDDAAFTRYVTRAFEAVAQRPQLVVLLGVVPTGPEVEYGWIQPGEPVEGVLDGALFHVRRFWEKPRLEIAKELLSRGYLWNSFMIVGTVCKLLDLVRMSVPALYNPFQTIQPALGTRQEWSAIGEAYARVCSFDFSGDVLCACPRALTVLPVEDANWTDLGSVDRVMKVLASHGHAAAAFARAS